MRGFQEVFTGVLKQHKIPVSLMKMGAMCIHNSYETKRTKKCVGIQKNRKVTLFLSLLEG